MSPRSPVLAAATFALVAAPLLAACVTPAVAAPAAAPAAMAHVTFRAADGSDRGMAMLTDAPSGVLLRLELKGLPPGWHGIHFHAKGDCSDNAAGFLASGAHIHAMERPHGLLNPNGPDMGDLPNVYAAADGTVNAELFTTLVSMKGAGGRPALADADGSAIVLHANPDDGITQPIGGAGARIACAVVQ
jgi:Cu-Zn family superoxide dismutase